jgi:hypothetical protein
MPDDPIKSSKRILEPHDRISEVLIQRGLLVGFSFKKLDLTTYVFNPDDSQPTVVVAVAPSF